MTLRLATRFRLLSLLALGVFLTPSAKALQNISVAANNPAWGSVNITPPGPYLDGAKSPVATATPKPGYTFIYWQIGSSIISGGSPLDVPLTGAGDYTLTAVFAQGDPAPTPVAPAIDVGKKGNANEHFAATSGSFLLTGTSVNVNQIQWNFFKGATHKVSVSGTKWSVKISPLKTGVNTIQISGWNTASKKGSKPISVIITRK